MPGGTFFLLHGETHRVGRELVEHRLTKAVAFTGSLKGGKALAALAAGRPEPIPLYAEMGSLNPLFALPGALRERGDDILLLANTFLLRHARRHGIEKISFTKTCEQAIQSHNWPGNVRELENAVERAVILADPGKKIEAELLGLVHLHAPEKIEKLADAKTDPAENPGVESMAEVEKMHISKILSACGGNRTHAAEKLGLNVRTLRNKIKQYSIQS